MPFLFCGRGRWPRLTSFALAIVAGAGAGLAQTSGTKPAPPPCPAVERLVWKAPQRIAWQLAETPLWFSLGHQARVMCFIPEAAAGATGTVVAVRIELHDVTAFEPGTAIPKETKLARAVTIRADDPQARELKKGWGFPTEQGKDFEFSLIPALEHQILQRLYRHDESQFWNTLMLHTEAKTEAVPPAQVAAAGSAVRFTEFWSYTVVCELLNDPSIKMTSTYIEPDDPPSTAWLEKEAVKAPWVAGKAALEPARGSLEFEGGTMRFVAFNDRAKQAAAAIATLRREQGVPSQSLNWEKDKGDALGLDADPGK
jgi:hypothetical protein